MLALKAVVKDRRLVMDEPADLPEGTELVLTVADEGDDMATRSAPGCTRRCDGASPKAGELIHGDEVIDSLLARS